MERNLHHEVTVTQAPPPEDDRGVASILRAFVRDPVAAMEVIGFIGGMYGLYYTLNHGIEEAKATSEQHYKDLSLQVVNSNRDLSIQIAAVQKDLQAQLTILAASDQAEVVDIKALYARSDVRYREILDKLNTHEVSFTKIATNMEYMAKQMEEGRMTFQPRTPHDQRMDNGNTR